MLDRTDVTSDPTFPGLHIRPDRGWLNDPNGLCRVDGRWHVFFQFNPAAPVHADVCWGHVSSADLLHWDDEPVAMTPRPGGPDAGGCWSGCVVDDAGTPTAVYTAVDTAAWDAGVVLARSDRTLGVWHADDHRQAAIPEGCGAAEIRDPFVFTFAGHRYAVQGAGRREGPPQLVVWNCDALTDWRFLGPLLTEDDPLAAAIAPAQIWECPNLFPYAGGWVLLVSLWRHNGLHHELSGVRYLIGDLDGGPEGLRFRTRAGGELDDGPTFYAPQVLAADERVLLWGWTREGDDQAPETALARGWAGALTFPRELTVEDDVLVSRPAAELAGLRAEELDPAGDLRGAFEVEATGPVRLELRHADGRAETVVEVDGSARILVDGSVIEVYAGPVARTVRAYPDEQSTWRIQADPVTTRAWRLSL